MTQGWDDDPKPRRERRPLALQVEYPDRQGYHTEWTETVSTGGMFIRTNREHEVGERLSLRVSFPGVLEPIEITGQVVWTRPPGGPQAAGVAVAVDSGECERQLTALLPLSAQPSLLDGPYARLAAIPRVRLGLLPTPLHRAERLSDILGGPEIWFKRDDLTGFALGGNKVRKLEFLAADALALGCETLVTGARSGQSNHVRITLAVAAHLGLKGVAVVSGTTAGKMRSSGNLLLNEILGGDILPADAVGAAEMDDIIAGAVEELALQGLKPYGIPVGGATWLGCAGYVLGTLELVNQLRKLEIEPAAIICAVGSCGTHAGVDLGLRWLGVSSPLIGVSISRSRESCQARVAELVNETALQLDIPVAISPQDVTVVEDYIGRGYGVATDEATEAIRLVARTEGIFLDPVYTGKAMAGLMDLIRRGAFRPGQNVVFLHTGGWPALFA